jgi:hypothetical protein
MSYLVLGVWEQEYLAKEVLEQVYPTKQVLGWARWIMG